LARETTKVGSRILEGKIGAYARVDIRSVRPREIAMLDSVDGQLAALGYEPVGDLVCSKFPDVLGRGYARPSGDTWGALFFGLIQTSFDFVTSWEAAMLTTTLNERGTPDDPKRGLYFSRHAKIGFARLEQLLEKHARRKEELSKKLGAPVPVAPGLRRFAEAIDRGIAMQLGSE
jgi:hypothetical protein